MSFGSVQGRSLPSFTDNKTQVLTCSTGVAAERGGSPQGGHRGRAAHSLHHPQLAMLDAGSSRAGTRGVVEPGGGRRERRGGGGRHRCGRGGQGDVTRVFPGLLRKDGELKERQAIHTPAGPLGWRQQAPPSTSTETSTRLDNSKAFTSSPVV